MKGRVLPITVLLLACLMPSSLMTTTSIFLVLIPVIMSRWNPELPTFSFRPGRRSHRNWKKAKAAREEQAPKTELLSRFLSSPLQTVSPNTTGPATTDDEVHLIFRIHGALKRYRLEVILGRRLPTSSGRRTASRHQRSQNLSRRHQFLIRGVAELKRTPQPLADLQSLQVS